MLRLDRPLPLLPLLLVALTTAAHAAELRRDRLPLADGGSTPRLTLTTAGVTVAVLPELGGKIIALSGRDGQEQLSRSGRPYRARHAGMPFGDSEYDGIDECFPTVAACAYPAAPWAGTALPDHGELWSQAWSEVPGAPAGSVVLEAHGHALPYTFRRAISVADDTVTLAYTVTNDGDAPLLYHYAFHPLLRGEVGGGLDWPAAQPLTVAYSHRESLGAGGTRTTWGALTRDGRPLAPAQFVPDSGRFYKYFATPLTTGRAVLRHADGGTLALAWDLAAQPHLAVWCWEGEYPGLNHLAPEPTTAPVDSLAQAIAANLAPSIPPHGTATWRITLTVTPTSTH